MSKRLLDQVKNSRLKKVLKRMLSPLTGLEKLKQKKIYGLTYFNKEDLKYLKQVRKNRLTKRRITSLQEKIATFKFQPKISVVMPVYNVEVKWLKEAIVSVFSPHIKEVLEYYKNRDQRVKVKFLETNLGISGASNEALSLASGDYVAFLDHDDMLPRDSLYEVIKLLNHHPQAGIIFSDEDKLTMGGLRLRPVYKPGWDPELFLTYNYLCHLVVCSRELIERAGGFRAGFEGSQDYDLLLRLTELTDNIFHISKVLYHWRMIPGSAAAVVDAKSTSFERAKRALADAMKRRGIEAEVLDSEPKGTFRINKKF